MKMTFGKFKGIEIREIEKSYLSWLLTLDNLSEDLKTEINTFFNEEKEAEKAREVAAQLKAEEDYKRDLEIGISFSVNKEDNVIYVQFPYSLKNNFRKEFKTNSSWRPSLKMWCVSISTRNINKMKKLGYKEVETFEYKTYEVKRSNYVDQEVFEDLCFDEGAYTAQARREVMRKYFS